ncbi:urease subunit gamma [Elizabethkingia anophelis]|uniref:urease subunit gamma n=1 Tax=Elizabethkingia anophelis TaxID=1117645 RepID=UPI00136C4151|nr:urease subunit gamma [Elizabethkingia anophelis]MDV4042193.1 urease subunit gamma [Elizabethkingia anophelis]MYY43906.1 urease subunit gamma [Elizabethkingia anophelis]
MLKPDMLLMAGKLALKRKEDGQKLNYPEVVAVISHFLLEGAQLLTKEDLMPGVAEKINDVQIEATFSDGTKLVTSYNPIRPK